MPNQETPETVKTPRPSVQKTAAIASLGCPKNLVDSESMVGRLRAAGYLVTTEAERVDLFLINTCGFLRSARQEAEEYIKEALEQKASGSVGKLVVSGCAVVSDGAELAALYPEVDAWIGPNDEARIVEIVESLTPSPANASAPESTEESAPALPTLNVLTPSEAERAREEERAAATSSKIFASKFRSLALDDSQRAPLTAPHVAYLKIADGCDRFCSYCAIPNIRGRYVSKPFETILDEAKRLADSGVRELVLIAQETTFWGSDLYGKPDLARLLAALKNLNLFDWIRLLYAYPLFWDADLVSLFKLEERGTTSILPYVDLPLQHCNSELLKRMNRRVDKIQTEELLTRLREEIPGVVLRTSFIVGFPGETDEMFQELVEFVERRHFERAGVFEFSPEPGTPALAMPNQVDPKTKKRRFERLYAKQERVSRQFARNQVGKTLDVLLDSFALDESGAPMSSVCLGRTAADAPDVDPVVYVTGRNIAPGEIVTCEIVEASALDLVAVPVDPDKIYVPKSERREARRREDARKQKEAKREKNRANRAKKRENRERNRNENNE